MTKNEVVKELERGDQKREAPFIRFDYYVVNGTININEIG
jgi:hypothetical protein